MRFPGVVLVFLAIRHLFIMLMWDNGVYRLDFNCCLTLGVAVLANLGSAVVVAGAAARRQQCRTIIDDYSRKDTTRFWLNSLLVFVQPLFT